MKKIKLILSIIIGCSFWLFLIPQIVKYYDVDKNYRGSSSVDSIIVNNKTKIVESWSNGKLNHQWIIKDTIFPTFIGGDSALLSYMNGFKYPESAINNKIQGKIFVQFVIEEDCTISDVKILKGIQKECDEEAIKMVTNMPKWRSPAYINGNPVKFTFVIPIQMKLK